MKIYKYNVDKIFLESSSVMENKKISNIAHGYVFAINHDEAIRTLESEYPSNKDAKYDIHIEQTNIIKL